MKTILVPVDFSAESKNALKVASSIAVKTNASLVVLHVIEAVDEGSFNVEGESTGSIAWEDRIFNMRMIEKSKRDLAKAVVDLEASGVKFKTVLRLGDAYHGMKSIITEQKTDLVVMGTKGVSGAEEALIGSNTEKVVRRAKCPVLTVTKRSSDIIRNIVWATSLRKEDVIMPAALKKIIDTYQPAIHLVRVNTPGLFFADKLVKEKLQSFADTLKLKNYTLNVYNDFTEEEGIIRFAGIINADVIALSTHGRTGLSHVLNGSIAEDVVNHAKRAVFTFHLKP